MVCLCKYHNWVTQGVGSLLNLLGPTPMRRNHGAEQGNFESLDRWKWHFQSLLSLPRWYYVCDNRNQNSRQGI